MTSMPPEHPSGASGNPPDPAPGAGSYEPVTLRAVADLAGVSVATASRVLTSSRATGADTKARVEDAAKRLGYRGNAIATALRKSSTRTVGMVVPRISNPFFPALVEAVEHQLQTEDVDLFLCDAQEDVTLERKRISALLARKVDGLLIVPLSQRASAEAVNSAATEVPLVLLDREVDGAQAPCVRGHDEAGIAMVLEHLNACGVRKLQFVSADLTTGTGRRRHDAYFAETAQHGMETAEPLLGDFSIEWGRTAGKRLLGSRDSHREPFSADAIVCGNDLIAAGILQECMSRGIRVPEDIMLVGYDDSSIGASIGLTTVRQPRDTIAASAVAMLRGPRPDGQRTVVFDPELIVRGTTKPIEHRGSTSGVVRARGHR